MGKYKVLVLGLQGRGKKVHKAGEVIDENQLPDGNAKELVKKGYLSPVKKSAKEKTAIKQAEKTVQEWLEKVAGCKEALSEAEAEDEVADNALKDAKDEDKEKLKAAAAETEDAVANAKADLEAAEAELQKAEVELAKID